MTERSRQNTIVIFLIRHYSNLRNVFKLYLQQSRLFILFKIMINTWFVINRKRNLITWNISINCCWAVAKSTGTRRRSSILISSEEYSSQLKNSHRESRKRFPLLLFSRASTRLVAVKCACLILLKNHTTWTQNNHPLIKLAIDRHPKSINEKNTCRLMAVENIGTYWYVGPSSSRICCLTIDVHWFVVIRPLLKPTSSIQLSISHIIFAKYGWENTYININKK